MLAMRPLDERSRPMHARSTRTPLPRSSARLVASCALAIGVALCAAIAFGAAATNVGATPLETKRAQAAELGRQVAKLDARFDILQERARGAQIELDKIGEQLATKRLELAQTRRDLKAAHTTLSRRAVAMYRSGNTSTNIVNIASAGSLTSFFDRVDNARRVSNQDADIVDSVETLTDRFTRKTRELADMHRAQAKVVARARADEHEMQQIRDQRQAKLNSVNGEIRAILEAEQRRREEAARQAALAQAAAARAENQAATSNADTSGGFSVSGPLPAPSATSSAAANAALSKLGAPYVWAASGPNAFDCSGLVMWAFAQAGRGGLPHSSYSLAGMGVDVPLSQVQAGDLVFGYGNGHVGIAISNSSFVHAPHTGDVVKVSPIAGYGIEHARRL